MADTSQRELDLSAHNSGDDEPPENEYDGPAFAEIEPSGRYGRFEEILGRGACKVVYKAFDTQEGTEVAWNQVRLSDLMCTKDVAKEDRDRMFAEIRVLKALKHKNIMSFYDSWYDPKTLTVNFITELFTSGTLRQYRKRHKHVDAEVLKRWAWQILCGLVYLHGHNPPIIHRDLKCDNIFINGSDGIVKIGDLGLATMLRNRTAPQSVLGTPEFMAPELYEEDYDDRVDVYSYGMALLELATLEYPYAECNNAAQIYRKVSLGVRPAGLQKVTSKQLAEFINTCIAPRNQRPRARQLLKHPYFDTIRQALAPSRSELSLAAAAAAGEALPPLTAIPSYAAAASATGPPVGLLSGDSSNDGGQSKQQPLSSATSSTSIVGLSRMTSPDTEAVAAAAAAAVAGTNGGGNGVDKGDGASVASQRSNVSDLAAALGAVELAGGDAGSRMGSRATSRAPSPPGSPAASPPNSDSGSDGRERRGKCRCAATNRCFDVVGKYREIKNKGSFNLRLRILEPDGSQRTVEFEFDNSSDTVASVAAEMVTELELSPEDVDAVALAMRQEIASLSANMEGQASSSLEAAAELLQQGLRQNALLAANSSEGALPSLEDSSEVSQLASVPEVPPEVPPFPLLQQQQPTAAVTLLRSVGSASSVHSETSMTSAHSVHSVQSSPAQLNGPSDSAQQQQRSVSPQQPSTHRLTRTSSVDRVAFRPAVLPPSREGGTPVSIERSQSDAMSPHNNSGILSPGDQAERRDLDKRSLNKLFENLQEVAREREGAVTPPPGSRPPLPPPTANGGNARQLAACKSSPPRVGWGIAALAAAPEPPPIAALANGNGNGYVSCTEQMLMCSDAPDLPAGMPLSCDAVGLIGAKKPTVIKDKEALRKQAADAMKAVEMRSLTLLEGSMGGSKNVRGTPMASNRPHGSNASLSSVTSSNGLAENAAAPAASVPPPIAEGDASA